MNVSALGRYLDTGSTLHRADSRAKLAALVLFVGAVFWADSVRGLLLLGALLLTGYALARLPVRLLARSLYPFWWLLAVTFLFQLFFSTAGVRPGSPGSAAWWAGGVRLGALYTFRVALMIGGAALLTFATSPLDLADGLGRLLAPLRGRRGGEDLSLVLTIALRFVPTLAREAAMTTEAQRARGIPPARGWGARALEAASLLQPLLARTLHRADVLAEALELRGWVSGAPRTRYVEPRFGRREIALAGSVVLAAVAARLAG